MRIGLFADMYLPHVSGVTNHIASYKRHYESLGHEVFVVTFGDTEYADAEPGVIRSPGIHWGLTGWRLGVGLSRRVRELIPTLDVAHVHHPFLSGRFVAPLAHSTGIPLVFTSHTRYDLYSDVYAHFVPQRVRHAFVRRSLAAFARRCDLVIAPSRTIAGWLAEFAGVEGARVIPNGIDVDAFAHPAQPRSRAALGFTPADVVVCFSGRLAPEKRVTALAEEFAEAARREPSLALLVLGDGSERSACERILNDVGLADRARFVGDVAPAEVASYLAAADVFATASVSEVHPLVVLEALAAGLPVVAISSPGIADTLADGGDSLLAPGTAPGDLAERLERLARDAAERERLSARARETARRYDFAHTADVVLEVYERLSAARREG